MGSRHRVTQRLGVGDVDDGRNGNAAFVHVTVNGNVRMTVNDAGDDELAGRIDHLCVGGSFYVGADFGDFSILD